VGEEADTPLAGRPVSTHLRQHSGDRGQMVGDQGPCMGSTLSCAGVQVKLLVAYALSVKCCIRGSVE
jgi:hypothetical protein